jgi:hypothetical protein
MLATRATALMSAILGDVLLDYNVQNLPRIISLALSLKLQSTAVTKVRIKIDDVIRRPRSQWIGKIRTLGGRGKTPFFTLFIFVPGRRDGGVARVLAGETFLENYDEKFKQLNQSSNQDAGLRREFVFL